MAGVTGKSQIDQATKKFLAESQYTLQERPGVVASSIRREKLPDHQGPSVNIPKYGQVTTYYLTEGVDMAQAQQITDTLMTLTPAEYGAQVVLTDMMLSTVKDEFFRVAGRILADSFDRQREEALCDDMGNYSNALAGGAADVFTLGHLMAGHAAIKYGQPAAAAGRGGEPGPDPVTCVCTPAQSFQLKKTLVGGVGDAAATQVVPATDRAAFSEQYSVAGVNVKTSVNINKDAADDAYLGEFSKEAQILVELGAGPGVEKERDASLRGWELNFVGRWARGEYNDSWGLEGLFDSASPTS
jgi:hypothetical protein